MEANLSKEEIEKLWKWIDRPLPPEFFLRRGPEKGEMPYEEYRDKYLEIPCQYRPLAHLIIELAVWHHKLGRDSKFHGSCCEFRQLLFILVKETNEMYPLPYYWFMDGVMVEPEWIVRLTNGLVKWTCDDSKVTCGLHGMCIFSE